MVLRFFRGIAPVAPPTSDFTAVVGHEPVPVAVYDQAGNVAHVPAADVDGWVARGFRRTPIDLRASCEELRPRFQALYAAFAALVEAVETDEELSLADLAVAQAAAGGFTRAIAAILAAAQLGYPLVEPDPVSLLDPEGVRVSVDPGQVLHYLTLGYKGVA